jgi:hypothetical protein
LSGTACARDCSTCPLPGSPPRTSRTWCCGRWTGRCATIPVHSRRGGTYGWRDSSLTISRSALTGDEGPRPPPERSGRARRPGRPRGGRGDSATTSGGRGPW